MTAKISKDRICNLVVTFDKFEVATRCADFNDVYELKASADILKRGTMSKIDAEIEIALSEFIKNQFKKIN